MAPSLGEHVLHQDLILHKILQNLSNVNDLRTIQGLVSLYAVKILSKDALKEHLARCEGIQYGVHYDEYEKIENKGILSIGQTDASGSVNFHVALYEYLEPGASQHVKSMVSYIKDMHRDHKIPYPKGRVSLNKLKKKKHVLREYGFLTYIPLSVYKTVRKGLAAQKLLRSRSVNELLGQGEAYPCFYTAFDCGLEVDLVKPLVPHLCIGKEHIAQQALVSASMCGHVDLIKCILEIVQVYISDPVTDAGTTVLHFAAQGGHLDVVRYLVEEAHAAVIAPTYAFKTPFMVAAEYGHIDIIKYLAQCNGVDVNEQDDDGMTALMLAILGASRGSMASLHWTSVVRCLIEEVNVDIEEENAEGSTALMLAVRFGLLDIVRYMIGTGKVDINKCDDKGLDLLLLAATENQVDVMRYLVEEVGLDIKAASRSASECGTGPVPSLFPPGQSVLTVTVTNGHVEMTKYLIETGCVNVNAKDQYGGTALMAACRNGHMETIKCLVEQGNADVFATDSLSNTCLIIAAQTDRVDIVKYLVEVGGAEVLQANQECKHVLQVAADLGSAFVVEYLIGTGKFNGIHSAEELDTIQKNASENEKRRAIVEMLSAAQYGDPEYGDESYSEDSYFSEDDDYYYPRGTGYSDEEIDVTQIMYMPEQFFFDDSDDDWRVQQAIVNNPNYRTFVQAMNRALQQEYTNMMDNDEIDSDMDPPPLASSSSRRGRGNTTNNNRGGRGAGRGGNTNSNRGRRGRGRGGGSRGRGRGEHNRQ